MDKVSKNSIMFLPAGILAWLISTLVLLPIAALICRFVLHGSQALGYVSSAICFISAAVAGATGERRKGDGALYVGVIMGCVILSIMILLGYIIDSESIDTGGIISITTFTLTGAVFGSVFLGKSGTKSRRRRIKALR